MIRPWLRSLLRYLQAPPARSANEFGDAIEEEIAFHLAERTREYTAQGMSHDEAHRAAVARFGDPPRVAAECHAGALASLAMWHRLHLGVTALLAVGVAILWQASNSPREDWLELAAHLPPGIATMLDDDWTGDVSGRIVDEHGRPIAHARVLVVVKAWPDQSYCQRAYAVSTDERGRFLLEDVHPVNDRFAVQIAAVAEQRVLKSCYRLRDAGRLEPVEFELPPSAGFAFEIQADEGGALADVEVLPQGRIEAGGAHHLVYFDSAQPLIRHTDARGRVELPYFQPGDKANVLVRAPRGDWHAREITVPPTGQIATIRASLTEQKPTEEL